jgi:hypothetical protein
MFHPASGFETLYDPVDHAEWIYSETPCEFPEFPRCEENMPTTGRDPDNDDVGASVECGNAAATALRFPVEVDDGLLTVTLTEPDPLEALTVGPPFLSGIRLKRQDEGPKFIRGNADAEGTINLSDGVFILNHLFLGGPVPPCLEAADADGNGKLNLSDAVYLFNHLFLGGPPPPEPHPECGTAEMKLGCESFPACPE